MIDKVIKYSFFEWKYLLMSVVCIPLMALLVHFCGVQKTKKYLEKYCIGKSIKSIPKKQAVEKANQIGRMVTVAARYGFYKGNCLKRAMVIWVFLSRLGIVSVLIFGAKRDDLDNFAAHAWVECYDEPIGEDAGVRGQFSVFE